MTWFSPLVLKQEMSKPDFVQVLLANGWPVETSYNVGVPRPVTLVLVLIVNTTPYQETGFAPELTLN